MGSWGKKENAPSGVMPLKLNSLESALLRPRPAPPADRHPLERGIVAGLERIDANPPDDFGLVGGVGRQRALAVECSQPVGEEALGDVAVDHGTGAAEGSGRGRIEERRQTSLDEVDVGDAEGSGFLTEWLNHLADGDLQLAHVIDVDEGIAEQRAVPVGEVGEERELVIRIKPALKTEAGPANREGVRGDAVAGVDAVVRLDVSIGLK